jgi:hypothetical protein
VSEVRKKWSRYGVSPEAFVQAWQASESLDEVATRLKMPKQVAYARGWFYRKKGIQLKTFPRRPRTLGVDELNKSINSQKQAG